MYDKILIAVAPDHLETIGELVQAARALASPGAEIEAFSVVAAIPTYIEISVPKSIYKTSADKVHAALETELAGHHDVSPVVEIGKPSEEIENYQKKGGHDLIILRSHDPSIKDFLIGSTASRVVRDAPCSIHVIR